MGDVFLGRVRVVETQVAGAAAFSRNAEVQADRLGVSDVQVAVRFGGNRVARRPWFLPAARSASMMLRMKSTGAVGSDGALLVWCHGCRHIL